MSIENPRNRVREIIERINEIEQKLINLPEDGAEVPAISPYEWYTSLMEEQAGDE